MICIALCEKQFFVMSITDMAGNVSCFERTIFWARQKAIFLCLTPQELKWIPKVLNCSLISATSVSFVIWLTVKQRLLFSVSHLVLPISVACLFKDHVFKNDTVGLLQST